MKTFEAIVAETFRIPESAVHDSMSSKDIADWDSMNYLLLISALEKRFGLTFTMDEVMGAETLGDIHTAVNERATIHGAA